MTRTYPRGTGYPGYSATMTRVPEAAREARVLARVALATWGLDDVADEAALLLSELVSNAVRHAAGHAVRVVVDRPTDERVILAVIDQAPGRLPQMRTPGSDDASGRGLRLVDALATQWGYDLMGSGTQPRAKRVWVVLDATRAKELSPEDGGSGP
ncbi:ATP-binding protein [Streptomyces sp. NPDC057280]|uniref:ATP-binding protein n=1 Tax=Streptomyces sp. NPDC057280 TaxID=3346081 RepID=UPI0036333D13